MPVITLVRHAQSEANANQNGDMYDPGITELGKEQAAQIEGHYDLVIISTLKRTRETLQHSKVNDEKYTQTFIYQIILCVIKIYF